MKYTNIETLSADVARWATHQPDIRAALVVGSYARGSARPDSDVDIMVLSERPYAYREDPAWVHAFDLSAWRAPLSDWRDAEYGPIWSRHFVLQDGSDIEFSFGYPTWAQTDPVDEGTRGVVRNGARILYDPEGLLEQLLAACQPA